MVEGLVSVIMPSYNTARFIADSIKSVQAQTYANWELLIVDDCSTDNTDEVVSEFDDERIIYLKNEKNSGAALSRNRALREAKGEWIAFLDSDDLWLPEKLQKQIDFMKNNHYYFTGTARSVIDEDSNPTGTISHAKPSHVTKLGMYLYGWPGCLTVMYHAPTVGLIQIADLKKNNDYAMWLKVIKKCDYYGLDEVLAVYRVRKNSIFHDSKKKLVLSFYHLYRDGEGMNPVLSAFLMCVNLFFGAMKKIFFVNK